MKRKAYTVQHDRQQAMLSRLTVELEQEPALAFAYLYGSLLDTNTVHDVDVGVYFYESKAGQGSALAAALSVNLTASVGLPVDVRILNEAPLSFLYHVLRGRLLVCHDEDLLTATIEDVARRYLDLAPFLLYSTKDAFAA